jgi:hypothetical protein
MASVIMLSDLVGMRRSNHPIPDKIHVTGL